MGFALYGSKFAEISHEDLEITSEEGQKRYMGEKN